MFSLKLRGLALALLSLALGQSAWGCPAVSRLADLNCDGKATVVVLGDSLVRGIGDTKNSNTGGYIIRTQEKFPGATIYGYGVPGLRTQPLLSTLKNTFAE
jgi:lysophospholipase L1-like esterase